MKSTQLAVLAATALAVAIGSTGCGNDDADHSSHSTSTTVTTTQPTSSTTTPAPTSHPASEIPNPVPPPPSPVPPPPPTPTPPQRTTTAPPAPLADVNCGPVTDAGGGTRTVIAVATPAGRVGCTEAINVATTYVTTISDSDVMTIDGWQCNAQPDPAVPSICTKNGLLIDLGAD